MATAHVQDEGLECAVCHENYDHPKILPCGHLLCRDCLVKWLGSSSGSLCPLCRSGILTTLDRSSGKTFEELADALPTDVAMAVVIESAGILRQHTECNMCPQVKATSLCFQCNFLLCESCVANHERWPSMRSHKIEELSGLTPTRLVASRPTPCAGHSEKTSKVYCSAHNVAVCRPCAASDHSGCPDVRKLEERLNEGRKALSELDEKLKTAEHVLIEILKDLDRHLLTTDENVQAACREIDDACDRLTRSVEMCRARLKDLIRDSGNAIKAEVQEQKTALGQRHGQIASHHLLVKRVEETLPCIAVFGMIPTLRTRIDSMTAEYGLAVGVNEINSTKMMIDQDCLRDLEIKIADIGQLCSRPTVLGWRVMGEIKFHEHHGKNIQLSDDFQVALRINRTDWGNAFVIFRDQMITEHLYEVRVEDVDEQERGFMAGVIGENPSTLTQMPDWSWDLPSSIIISPDCVYTSGNQADSEYGQDLRNLSKGSRVGVLLAPENCLHLFVDGVDQGIAVSNVPQPCWAVYALMACVNKIKGLPVRAPL